MDVISSFAARYERTREEELSLEEYLAECKRNPVAYATAAERMLKAIGEPQTIDTRNDPRLSRIFANKIIKIYPAFAEFYGMEDAIEQVVSYFRHAAQGLEEKKQILYLLGPVGGGKSSIAERLKALMQEVPFYAIKGSPVNESPLGLFDCCGVSDGAAAAIVTTPEIAKALGKANIVSVKALQLSVSNGSESGHNSWDGSYFHTTRIASKKAYEEAGIKNPRNEVSMFEVHDCFSVTELVTMEDLHISENGKGWKDVLDGFYDADGKIPCQIDGGLKCFGHPIGASGLRMLYEMYLQFQGRAGARQLKDPRIGMTHNLGGAPRENVSSVAIVGRYE